MYLFHYHDNLIEDFIDVIELIYVQNYREILEIIEDLPINLINVIEIVYVPPRGGGDFGVHKVSKKNRTEGGLLQIPIFPRFSFLADFFVEY